MGLDYDVIVVGANVAGATTARELAQRGFRVALVEREQGPAIGWNSCGDGIECFQFAKLGLDLPKGDFVLRNVDVAYVISPDRQVRLVGESAGIAIDRFGMNQHLLTGALEAGAELMDSTDAVGPIIEDQRVSGVRLRTQGEERLVDLRSSVTVDATGWRGRIRRTVPAGWPIAEEIPREEMALAYREERRRPSPVPNPVVEATIDYEITPRGVYWVADRTDILVNIGTGMQWVPGIPNPRRVVRQHVIPLYPDLKDTEVIRARGGIIPNRRPIDCPVAPGLVAVGDAACQVQPLSGSGIGASMYAARLAAEGMAKAIESTSTPGLEDLFPYAHAYHSTYGGDQAANQLVREFLQSLSNAQINRLMDSRILSEEEVVSIARNGRLDLSFVDKLRVLGKLIGEPRLIRGLSRLRNDMETAKRLYSDYPVDHMELDGWSKRASAVFKRV